MAKTSIPVWLVEFNGEPFPKRKDSRAPLSNWVVVANVMRESRRHTRAEAYST